MERPLVKLSHYPFFERKAAEGKTKKEAVRAVKRRISDAVYRQLVSDARTTAVNRIELWKPLNSVLSKSFCGGAHARTPTPCRKAIASDD